MPFQFFIPQVCCLCFCLCERSAKLKSPKFTVERLLSPTGNTAPESPETHRWKSVRYFRIIVMSCDIIAHICMKHAMHLVWHAPSRSQVKQVKWRTTFPKRVNALEGIDQSYQRGPDGQSAQTWGLKETGAKTKHFRQRLKRGAIDFSEHKST